MKLCCNLEDLQLSTSDQQMLSGVQGLARQKALSIVARMAKLQGATSLVDVKQVRVMAKLRYTAFTHGTRFSNVVKA